MDKPSLVHTHSGSQEHLWLLEPQPSLAYSKTQSVQKGAAALSSTVHPPALAITLPTGSCSTAGKFLEFSY